MLSVFDRLALAALLIGCLALSARGWLHDHPQHDPWAPLDLADPPGWATGRKLAALRAEPAVCRAFLERSAIAFIPLAPQGTGACRRGDRGELALPVKDRVTLAPRRPQATCPVDAGLALWMRHGVQPLAEVILHSRVVRIEHLGTYNCRRIGGRAQGTWSEHARGNAIDVAAFVLADGRRISVRRDWSGRGRRGTDAAAFLHAVRDSACQSFSTVLSPDYNAAHADHFHLDQARRSLGWSACR